MKLPLLLPLALCLAAPRAPRPDFRIEKPMREAFWGDRQLEGLRLYDALASSGAPLSGQAHFLAGKAYWTLHQPEKAKDYFQKAFDAGFESRGIAPGAYLDMIARFEAAAPPAVAVPGLDAKLIELHMDERTPLTALSADALPRFVELGRRIFGGPPPAVRFYLFADPATFDAFIDALGDKRSHSTGFTNMVIVDAPKARRASDEITVSMSLHETGHAWTGTYLRYKHDHTPAMPTYIVEGLAVYIEMMWAPDLVPLHVERLRKAARRKPPPDFDELKAYALFHSPDGGGVNYMVSGLLMERLFGPSESGASTIPRFLDAWARSGGDDAAAWKEATGKDVREEYAALVREYWPNER